MDWAQACEAQYGRTQSQLRQANNAGNIFAIIVFLAAAVFSCVCCCTWKRVAAQHHMWTSLGRFSALMCLGSVAGALAWLFFLYTNELGYRANDASLRNQRQKSLDFEAYNRWFAVFLIMYGLQFLCLILCKLMLLGRLTDGSALGTKPSHTSALSLWRRLLDKRVLRAIYRLISAVVLACSVTSMLACIAAGAYDVQLAGIMRQSASLCDAQGNPTNASDALQFAVQAAADSSNTAGTVQSISEAVALVLISADYLLLVLLSVAAFRHEQEALNPKP